MKILLISQWFPYPPNNGSKLRIYNLLRGLAEHHQVTLLSVADQPDVAPDISALGSLCQEIRVVPVKLFNPHSYKARLGFLKLTPRSVIDTFSVEMKENIEQILSDGDYDLVVASQIDTAVYAQYFRDTPALFEEIEIGAIYEQFTKADSLLRRLRYGLTWFKHRHYLKGLLRHFGACTVVSEPERQLLRQAAPNQKSVEVIPNCINLADYNDVHHMPQPNTLIFTGSLTFYPNHEAMIWFLSKVYPLIQAQIPDVRLAITGDHANLPLPPAANVTLTGFVDDIRSLIASSWISLVPIWAGGGTRLKILEAMALGTPIVTTSKGAEGLDVTSNRHLLIADTPETFADETIRLLKDPDLHQRLSNNGFELVREKYDWKVVMPTVLSLVDALGQTERQIKSTVP